MARAESATSAPPALQRVTFRAVALGLLLVPLNAWWLIQIEYVRYSDNATTSALFFNCIAVLLLLQALNALLRRHLPRLAFTRAELLTVYIILIVASALGGHDQLQILFTTLHWVFRNATPQNRWAEDIQPLLPRHLVVSDPRVIDPLYLGGSSLYERGRLLAWAGPLAWWTLFALGLVWTLLCLSALFRRQWENERLNYPITEPPLEITAPGGPLFRSRLFWIGAVLAAVLQTWNLLHTLYPIVPGIALGVHNYVLRGLPWSAAGAIPVSSFPFAYGLAYLLPLQLSFSVWFFLWFARLEMIGAAAFGYTQWGGFPYIQQQGVGAYFGVTLFVLWAARGHLARVWRAALGRLRLDDSAEPLPYPWALWGFAVGLAFLLAFSVAAGMRPLTAFLFFALLFPIMMTIARLRAEIGLPTIELYQVGAEDILQRVAGTRAWTGRDLTVMSLYFWLTRTHRQLPMPVQVDSLRLGQQCPMSLRSVAGLLLAAALLGTVASFWAQLHIVYQVGYESAKFTGPAGWAFGNAPWQKLASWLQVPRRPELGPSLAYLVGLGTTLLLALLRTRLVWWPFHPAGYLVLGSFGLFRLWLPIFLTWLIKSVLLRYGGLAAYRQARPFFFGLILGEFLAAFVRSLVDLALNLHFPATSGIGGL